MSYDVDERAIIVPDAPSRGTFSPDALGLLVAGVAGMLALVVALLAVMDSRQVAVLIAGVFLVLSAASLLAWRGYLSVARYLVTTIVFALVVFTVANLGSLSLTLLLLPLFIVGAGVLLSSRDALVYGFLSLLAYDVVAYVQTQRDLSPFARQIPAEAFAARVVVGTLALLATTLLVSAGVRRWEAMVSRSSRRSERMLSAMEVGLRATSSYDVEAMLDRTVQLIRDQFGYEHAQIFLLDRDGEHAVLRASTGHAGQPLSEDGHRVAVGSLSVVGQVTAGAGSIVALDADMDLVRQNSELLPGMRSELAVPLQIDDRIMGVLDVQRASPKPFVADDIDALVMVAEYVAATIDRVDALAQEAGLLKQDVPTALASRELAVATDLDEVLDILHRHVARDFDRLSLLRVERGPAGQVFGHTLAVWDREDLASYGVNFDVLGLDVESPSARIVERAERLGEDETALKDLLERLKARTFAAFPLIAPGGTDSVTGYLLMYARELHVFDDEEIATLMGLSEQLAVVMARHGMLETISLQRERLTILNELSRGLSGFLDLDAMGPQLAEGIERLLGYRHLSLALLDERGDTVSLQILSADGEEQAGSRMFPLEGTAIGAVVHSAKTMVTPDLSASQYKDHQAWYAENIEGAIVAPASTHGKVSGTLNLGFGPGTIPTDEDVSVLEQLATQLATALESARLADSARHHDDETRVLQGIAGTIGATRDLEELLKQISIRTAQASGAERCTVFLVDDEVHKIGAVTSQYADEREDLELRAQLLSLGNILLDEVPLLGKSVGERQPILANDIEREELGPDEVAEFFDVARLMAVPLVSRDRAIGVMVLDHTQPEVRFSAAQVELATTIASQVSASIENMRLTERLERYLNETRNLYEASLAIGSSRSLAELLEASVGEIARLSEADRVRAYLSWPGSGYDAPYGSGTDPYLQEVVQWWEDGQEEVRYQPGLRLSSAEVLPFNDIPMNTDNVVFNDLADSELLSEPTRRSLKLKGVNSMLVLPLVAGEAWLGAVVIEKYDARSFDEEMVRVCRSLCDQTALALNAQRMQETTRQTESREYVLRDINAKLRQARDLESVLQVAVEELGRVLDAKSGSVEIRPVSRNGDTGHGV